MSARKDVARRSRWPYISLLPIGLDAWAPVDAGARARRPLWILLGIIWSALVIAGFIVHDTHNTEGALLIIGWVGAIATSFSVRPASRARTRPSRRRWASVAPTAQARRTAAWSTSPTSR